MYLDTSTQGSSNPTPDDLHLNFAEYFFKDELKYFAWLVSKKLEEGNICVRLDEIENLPGLDDKSKFKQLYQRFLNHNLVTTNPNIKQPFIVYNDRLYLQR